MIVERVDNVFVRWFVGEKGIEVGILVDDMGGIRVDVGGWGCVLGRRAPGVERVQARLSGLGLFGVGVERVVWRWGCVVGGGGVAHEQVDSPGQHRGVLVEPDVAVLGPAVQHFVGYAE